MSSPNKASPPQADSSGNNDERPRLTEEEKKQNHIASEQKRRQAIRGGFDRLCDLVPGLEGQGRSEGMVLRETINYAMEQLAAREAHIEKLEAQGVPVDPKYKEALNNPLYQRYKKENQQKQQAGAGPSQSEN